nr:reverse transcriptase domain-containing protein [Tanacetum cinerariifolium]
MRTRSNFYPFNSTATIPRRSNSRRILNIVEPEIQTIAEIVSMADRTMEELLQAPTEGYGEAILIPEILAENFEIKMNLLQDVSNDAIKLMLFPYSLEDAARIWACPHHGFSKLTQIDTFYNGLTEQDQDSLNAAAGGNLLNKTTREALKIIENKSKVRYSRSRSNVSRVNTNSRDIVSKTDDRIDKLADQISNLVDIVNKQVIAPAKAVEKTCVACGGAHAYYDCIATDSNHSSVCAATGSYNQVSPPNRASHQISPHGFAPVQKNPNRFNQGHGNYFNQANNFNQGNNFRGNNFQNNHGYRAQMNNVTNFQNQGFQNQPFLVPNNQIPPSVPNEFSSYMKSNEIMIKSMQNQINVLRGDFNKQEENLRRNLNNDMRSILGSFFQNQPSTSGTLPSNTVPNPKGEMKVVTTRSGLAYKGPSIPTEYPLEKVDEQNTKEILDKEHSNSSESTAQVKPSGVPILILEPDVPRTQKKPTIPYTSRLNDQKLREKATNQMEKFFQIFHDLHFDISFVDALLLMPKFASTIKSLLTNKDKLFELAKVSLNENCSAMLLKNLLEKLGDPVQSQRRVNPKIHDVIKKDVIKLLDAGMIYPISDNPWVSPIHYVPKKGGMTVVANENNELIPTYRKLNDATRKDHFPLPFMDQMLERLAGNEFHCFLDGFSGEGIVLGHKISKSGIEVDRAKDFSKIARPMTHLLEKETPFVFSKQCIDSFNTLKKKLTEAPILVVLNWNLPFELMCDASDYAIGAVLGQRKSKHFQPVHYASKMITEAQIHYTMIEKEMLAVVYAFEKFRPYLVLSKSIVYTDHSALKLIELSFHHH